VTTDTGNTTQKYYTADEPEQFDCFLKAAQRGRECI